MDVNDHRRLFRDHDPRPAIRPYPTIEFADPEGEYLPFRGEWYFMLRFSDRHTPLGLRVLKSGKLAKREERLYGFDFDSLDGQHFTELPSMKDRVAIVRSGLRLAAPKS